MTRTSLQALPPLALRLVRQTLVLTSWAVLYFAGVLIMMMGLIRFTTGWDVVVLTSGSMSPTLRPGDVLFLDDHPAEPVGQQTVITFKDANGELVTHRVFETNRFDETYVTKGDANPTPDADIVSRDQVVGVGWLVIPFLGLPVIWLAEGNFAALAAMTTVTLIALVTIIASRRNKVAEDAEDLDDRLSSSAQRGIVRVRIVVGLIIAMLIALDNRDLAQAGILAGNTFVLIGALVALGAVTVLARFRSTRMADRSSWRMATFELAADTMIVVVFVAASGSSSIGWILMALPIIEAAVHFKLTGAFIHWIVMSAMSVSALFWTNRISNTPQSTAIASLEQLIDRLGVLLLIVIPASYLAEQLLGDVLTQRNATRRAHNRSDIIERVTDAGLDVARLGVDVFPRLTQAAIDLGFDSADCWTGDGLGDWHLLARSSKNGQSLPQPANAAGTMRHLDLGVTEVFIVADDPDETAAAALDDAGFALIARLTLVQREAMYVVLRVGGVDAADDPSSLVMALRLLTAQAGIALQNERLLSELKETHKEIEHRAKFDALTGLPNRSHFSESLTKALESDASDQRRLTVMFLDLNGFKAVNDRLGHQTGDELLAAVADRLRRAIGDRGIIARLGGDEFTVLLPDRDPEFGDHLAARIHEHVNAPFQFAGEVISVGTSIGIAVGEPGVTVSEMMRRADVAMYAAKGTGGANRTRRYTVDLDEADRRTDLLARSLRGALERNELHLLYQPIVDAVFGTIVGIEALVRWTHPDLGPIPTAELLDIAESGDCIAEFNRWILTTATTQVARLGVSGDERARHPFIAVNVSPTELELGTLKANVEAALVASGIPPERLVIELSEKMIAESPTSIENIARLQSVGVRLALDDFGEGHTSLTYLRRLPIDMLKLDRTFVLNASTAEADRTVLRSVVALAHELGFSVVAEGVENIDQMSIVTKAGADLIQGYGLYRPLSLADLRVLLGGTAPTADRLAFGDLAGAMPTLAEIRVDAVVRAPSSPAPLLLPPPTVGTRVS